VNVEVKDPDLRAVDVLVALLERRDGADDVLVSSFHLPTVDRVHEVAPAVPTGLLTTGLDPLVALAMAVAHGHAALHPDVRSLSDPQAVVEQAHAAGLQVNVWTVNGPDDVLRLRDAGVDAVITDVPDLVRVVLRG
jgi:glycerophosphoryl diester phosphodiesterase